ncbi:MAG: hypothetical protein H0W29_16495, partial [Gemmatimonadales bacterium]|nr:hypothetical protein [Gemmatimonadales bacterium]
MKGLHVESGTSTPLDPERLRLIEEIGKALGGVSGMDDVLRAAASAMVPRLADVAVVLADGQGGTEWLDVAHVDAASETAVRHAITDALPWLRGLARAELRTGRTFCWGSTANSRSAVHASQT